MKNVLRVASVTVALCIGVFAGRANANVLFSFAEAGGTVTMTSSGTLDTTKLVLVNLVDGWGGTGTEDNGQIDIMGGTSFGPVDLHFGFHAGTDASAIQDPGGPFAFSEFNVASISGNESFTTYSGFIGNVRQPGIGVVRSDLVGGLWTPNQDWIYGPGATFASLGLNVGTYSVSDALTGETITIEVGAVPEPGTLFLLGTGLCAVARRRLKK